LAIMCDVAAVTDWRLIILHHNHHHNHLPMQGGWGRV